MTVEEAAKQLKYTKSAVCNICRRGEFPGARRVGQRVWIIPRASVMNYKRGLQGFAAVQARKRAEKEVFREALNNVIRDAKSSVASEAVSESAGAEE